MIDKRLLTRLNSADAETRRQAIIVLTRTHSREALMHLEAATRRELDPEVRELARRGVKYLRQHLPQQPETDHNVFVTTQGSAEGDWGEADITIITPQSDTIQRAFIAVLLVAGIAMLAAFMLPWLSNFGYRAYDGFSMAQRAAQLPGELAAPGPGLIAYTLWLVGLTGVVQVGLSLHLFFNLSIPDQWYWTQAIFLGFASLVPLSWVFLSLVETMTASGAPFTSFLGAGFWIGTLSCVVLVGVGYAGLMFKH
jgi:hypothetical protein